jgi:hypothetical protein
MNATLGRVFGGSKNRSRRNERFRCQALIIDFKLLIQLGSYFLSIENQQSLGKAFFTLRR